MAHSIFKHEGRGNKPFRLVDIFHQIPMFYISLLYTVRLGQSGVFQVLPEVFGFDWLLKHNFKPNKYRTQIALIGVIMLMILPAMLLSTHTALAASFV